MSMVFSGSAALAGLILVFLGSAANAFDGYETTEKTSVRAKFQLRAWLSLGGLISALAASGLALGYELSPNLCLFNLSIFFVSLAGAVLLIVAALAVADFYA